MSASLMFDLVAMAAAGAMPQAGDCRAIADPAARLACYDSRAALPSAATPPSVPAPSYAPPPAAVPPPASTAPAPVPPPRGASSASVVRADPTGRVVSVTPLRYGLFRVALDDGRSFDTATNTDPPPPVGASVRLRRTPLLGTTFLDVPGRNPITVRLVRR